MVESLEGCWWGDGQLVSERGGGRRRRVVRRRDRASAAQFAIGPSVKERNEHDGHVIATQATHLTVRCEAGGHEVFADLRGLHPARNPTPYERANLLHRKTMYLFFHFWYSDIKNPA